MAQREFAQRLFDHICIILPERERDGTIVTHTPHLRYENSSATLHKFGAGPFCRFRPPALSKRSGVYILTVNGDPRYVGECANLRTRFETGYGNISPRNCFQGGQSTNCKVNQLILETAQANAQIDLWFRPEVDRKLVESDLILELRPRWNGKYFQRETVVGSSVENPSRREEDSNMDYRSRPPGPHADQVLSALLELSNICDDCLSLKTQIQPRQQVNQICRKLHLKNLIRRFSGGCDHCGGFKTINSRSHK